MTEEERNKILVRAIATYGEVSQINKAIEEMAELTKALCKFRGAEAPCEKDAAIGNIIEEMADVQIMLDQLKIIFKHDIEPMQRFKLQRLNQRIEWREGNKKSTEPPKKTLSDKIIQAIEEAGFEYGEIEEQSGEYYIELRQYTPEGEDWNVIIWFDGTDEGFEDHLANLVEEFDVDEEAEIWINGRGQNGVPNSISAILKDAEWKLEKLTELESLL